MKLYQKSYGLACCLAMAASVASATDRLVPGTFATVQAAIDACAPSGDRVLIGTAGTYLGTVPIPTKGDVSINVIGTAGNQTLGKNVTIEGGVAGVILGSTVKIEFTSTATLKNVTCNPTAGGGSKGIVLNDTDTVYPSDFSCVTLNGTTVTGCSDNGIRSNSANIITMTNSAIIGSTNANLITDGNAKHATFNLTNSTISGSVNSNGIGIHRHANLTASGCSIINNKGFGIFVDSFDDVADGRPNFTLTNTSVSGNLDRSMFLARAVTGSATGCTFTGPAASNDLFLFQYGNSPYNLSFTNCTINESAGNGLAIIAISNGGPTNGSTYSFNQCVISGGKYGNVHFDNEADLGTVFNTLTMDRCSLRCNVNAVQDAFTGANLDLEDTKATLTNCIFDEGTTGVLVRNGNTTKVYHCTIVSRSSITTGGVEIRDQRAATANSEVRNSIVDGPKIGVFVGAGLTPVISNNLVNGTVAAFSGIASAGNSTGQSPAFVTATTGPGTGNFHLQNVSSAISIGVAGLSSTDYDGGVRPLPAATPPDAGAYENATSHASGVTEWSLFM